MNIGERRQVDAQVRVVAPEQGRAADDPDVLDAERPQQFGGIGAAHAERRRLIGDGPHHLLRLFREDEPPGGGRLCADAESDHRDLQLFQHTESARPIHRGIQVIRSAQEAVVVFGVVPVDVRLVGRADLSTET